MNRKIILYGVPGAGKTYVSQKMAQDLDLPLFEGDQWKAELRKHTTKEQSPFLFFGTCQAYRYFGALSRDTVLAGLHAVRKALADKVMEEVQGQSKGIFEGAFFDPNLLQEAGELILVVTVNEAQHRKQFFEHREESQDNLNELNAARIVQEFLINEARNLGVRVTENQAT